MKIPTDLLSGAGHGLLNRLSGISLAAETAELAMEKQQPEMALRLIRRLQEGIGSFQQLLEGLLLANRLVQFRQQLDFSSLESAVLGEWITALLSSHPEADRLRVKVKVSGSQQVRADKHLVSAVLGQLLGNALKFSAPNGEVEVQLEAAEGGLRIAVSDHGIGIPPAEMSRVGEPFFRASNVGGRGGIGLGICIVQGIAALHSGALGLDARAGGGTIARVYLPATPGSDSQRADAMATKS